MKPSLLSRGIILVVEIYQLAISPFIGPRCRFIPTCSRYTITAIYNHGTIKGSWLSLKRICRCHPWGGFGYDPVPPPDDSPKHPGTDL